MKKQLKTAAVAALPFIILTAVNSVSAQVGMQDYSNLGPQGESGMNVNYYFNLQLQSPQRSEGGQNISAPFTTGSSTFTSGAADAVSITSYANSTANTYTSMLDGAELFNFAVGNITSFSIELSSSTGLTNQLSNISLTSSDNQVFNIPVLTSANGQFEALQVFGLPSGNIQLSATETFTSANGTLPSIGAETSFIGDAVSFDGASVPEPASIFVIAISSLLCIKFTCDRHRRNAF